MFIPTEHQVLHKVNGLIRNVVPALSTALKNHGTLLGRNVPGLPNMPEDPEVVWSKAARHHLFVTPWGLVKEVMSFELEGDTSSFRPLYKVVETREGDEPLPEPPHFLEGIIGLDTITGRATVYVQDDDDTWLPIHTVESPLPLDSGRKFGPDVFQHVRASLTVAGLPILPTVIYRDDSAKFPWDQKWNAATPRVRNDQIGVPVVGYVRDDETEDLVYLHIVGHKAALESIWATLNQGGGKGGSGKWVHLTVANENIVCRTSRNYATFSSPVDPETGIYRKIMIDRRALIDPSLMSKKTDVVYLLGGQQDTLFSEKLDATLPIPILPEWGETLRREGFKANLIRRCSCGGDVSEALVIDASDRWLELIQSLIQTGDLSSLEAV